jgi:hypothetical protein
MAARVTGAPRPLSPRAVQGQAGSVDVPGNVRPALLLFVPLLACTAPNPAYLVSRDARGDRQEMDARSDSPADPAPDAFTDPDASGPGPRDAGEGDARTADAPAAADGPTGVDAPIGPAGPGLVLHWRFDEPAGSIAVDSSGHGFEGTYGGSPLPSPSAEVPPTTFANPGSRRFDATVVNSVQLASMPAALQPTQALTVTVWFRTTQTTRADLVCHGGDYFIRWNVGEMEFVRRRPLGSSANLVSASGPAPTANDGRWHHAAGVASPDGDTMIYLDGTLVDRDVSRLPFTYVAPNALIVGRSMAGGQVFDGWLDEVRIYDRVLSENEIRALARGEP